MRTALSLTLLTALWTTFTPPIAAQNSQTQAAPQFEVTSIKPSLSGSIQNLRPLPGRLTADVSTQVLIQYAYGIQPFQVIGGPNWIRSDRYRLEATADANANADRMFLMLRNLLGTRFQLKT